MFPSICQCAAQVNPAQAISAIGRVDHMGHPTEPVRQIRNPDGYTRDVPKRVWPPQLIAAAAIVHPRAPEAAPVAKNRSVSPSFRP